MNNKPRLLVVDDEPFNLDILQAYLEQGGYAVVTADDGDAALTILESDAAFDAIILDRMMPRLDGMAVLKQLKNSETLREIPVIMQTAAASHEQVAEGIAAGAYYYLPKPYDEMVLLSLVRAAVEDSNKKKEINAQLFSGRRALSLMRQADFAFRTLQEAKELAQALAYCFPDPLNAAYGLTELMVNAVEHGNLGISHDEKTQLIKTNTWEEEVIRRLSLPAYRDKQVRLSYRKHPSHIEVIISDEGAGFEPEQYARITPERAFLPHGRGIAMTKMLAFPELDYADGGRTARCRVALPAC